MFLASNKVLKVKYVGFTSVWLFVNMFDGSIELLVWKLQIHVHESWLTPRDEHIIYSLNQHKGISLNSLPHTFPCFGNLIPNSWTKWRNVFLNWSPMDVEHLLLVLKRSSFILTFLKHNLKVALLENVWTNQYNQPPNSILGGLHMTRTCHDFVAHEQIPLEN
jgi:hypothetical protein